MARCSVLLFGLWWSVAALCLCLCPAQKTYFPPTLNISLDEDPELRWNPLLTVFDTDFLKKAAAEIIE